MPAVMLAGQVYGRNNLLSLEASLGRGVVAATSDRTNEEGPYGYWPGGAGSARGRAVYAVYVST